jgi:hypothetical protein
MSALFEIHSVRQIPAEGIRRWFTSSTMDLFVWTDLSGDPTGFQFTYDKGRNERAFTWKRACGFLHDEVDDGENHGSSRYKETPLLRADGRPDIERIASLLATWGDNVPSDIVAFVIGKVREYPSGAEAK